MSSHVRAEPYAAFRLLTDVFQASFHTAKTFYRKYLVRRILTFVYTFIPFYQFHGNGKQPDHISGFSLYPVPYQPGSSVRIRVYILISKLFQIRIRQTAEAHENEYVTDGLLTLLG